jgi:hypothetical protein
MSSSTTVAHDDNSCSDDNDRARDDHDAEDGPCRNDASDPTTADRTANERAVVSAAGRPCRIVLFAARRVGRH